MAVHLKQCDTQRLRLLAGDRLPPDQLAEVEEHLANCVKCQALLDQLAGEDRWLDAARQWLGQDCEHGNSSPSAAETLDFLAPSDFPDSLGRLGPYEVKGLLGHGGNGIVLKAVDPALNRTIAIKVMAVHLAATTAARQRFKREARAAAAVVHEHVVAVYAVDEAGKLPYLVMEYVPGRSLQERLDRQGPLSLLEILRIGMQSAAGLAAAHAQGLVHRDVKPANILLDNGIERARLTDFGLARAAADAALTQSWVVAGTPHYMAPEQARGEPVDHRADLFSLGSTLYAMCTGHPPFHADSAVAVLRRVSDTLPRPVREINSEVPKWLAGIIAKLHAKEPDRRFQSAAEVADLLGRCLAHVQQPIVHPLPPLAKKLGRQVLTDSRQCLPRRRWATAAVLMTALGGAALAVVLLPKNEDRRSTSRAAGKAAMAETKSALDGLERFDFDFAAGSKKVHEQLAAVERSLATAAPGDGTDFKSRLAELNEWASTLQHGLRAGASPSADPIDLQLNSIRRRLELLIQRAGNTPRLTVSLVFEKERSP